MKNVDIQPRVVKNVFYVNNGKILVNLVRTNIGSTELINLRNDISYGSSDSLLIDECDISNIGMCNGSVLEYTGEYRIGNTDLKISNDVYCAIVSQGNVLNNVKPLYKCNPSHVTILSIPKPKFTLTSYGLKLSNPDYTAYINSSYCMEGNVHTKDQKVMVNVRKYIEDLTKEFFKVESSTYLNIFLKEVLVDKSIVSEFMDTLFKFGNNLIKTICENTDSVTMNWKDLTNLYAKINDSKLNVLDYRIASFVSKEASPLSFYINKRYNFIIADSNIVSNLLSNK